MDELPKHAQWVKSLDITAVQSDFNALLKDLTRQQSVEDVKHLEKIIFWAQCSAILGLAALPLKPTYVFPSILIAFATFVRWTCVGHHVCHGGYNGVVQKGSRFDRFQFAVGSIWRRLADWPDWMDVAAWNYEHNHLHHYRLNENSDPDLVEQNLTFLRGLQVPVLLKYVAILFFMTTWKWFYYASNTYVSIVSPTLPADGGNLQCTSKI